jgi:molybdopterin-guanine dinucleotide biosynthesis protein A
VAVAVVGEREQPLTACWRRSVALAVLEAGFASGVRAPRHLLDALAVVRVPGLSPAALADVDSPEDLRRYAEAPTQTPTTEQDPP